MCDGSTGADTLITDLCVHKVWEATVQGIV